MHYASIEDLTKSFGVREIFSSISFHVEEGDKIAFVARNGSGKSTLLKIIAGKDQPDSGTVWVHKDVKVIMLLQETDFANDLSIWDNVLNMENDIVSLIREYEIVIDKETPDEHCMSELAAKITDADAWNFESEVKQILSTLDLHHPNETVKNLSGGQKKKGSSCPGTDRSQVA